MTTPFSFDATIAVVSRKRWLVGAAAVTSAVLALSAGCASKPEAPIVAPQTGAVAADTAARLDALLPTAVLLLGEQHDAAQHQQIEAQVIASLAARGELAAVALEMADAGVTTANLHPSSPELRVKLALRWVDEAWPWAAYGPAVMTAVRAGVPVVGANLPRSEMKAAMADSKLDVQLPGPALKAQQQKIRTGHCNLLPENQITPMTRIQIAKDMRIAETVSQATVPGKVVVLLTGSGHADPYLGVPQHLPETLRHKSVLLMAGTSTPQEGTKIFDAVWSTPAVAEKDYCADFQRQMGQIPGQPKTPSDAAKP